MKTIIARISEYLPPKKDTIIILAASFLISVFGIVTYPQFILRGVKSEEFSVFSIQFIKSGIYSFLMWVYVAIMLSLAVYLLRKLTARIKMVWDSWRQGGLDVRRVVLVSGGFVLALVSALVLEYFWGHVVTGTTLSTGGYFNRFRFLFFCCVSLAVYVLGLYGKKIIQRFESLFLLLTLIIGLCFAFGLPMSMISWDDGVHYYRSLSTSHLAGMDITRAENDMMNMEIPVTYNIKELTQLQEELSRKDDVVYSWPRDYRESFYRNTAYVMSGVIIGLCRMLQPGYAFYFYMGRYANLIVYALLVYLAMGRLKAGKLILAVIAMFPINIFLATNYSYDFFMTGLCMLGFSYLIGEWQRPEEKLSVKNAVILLLAFFFGVGVKAIYFPLLLLCFLLPESKFATKRMQRIFRIAVAVAVVVTIASFLLPMFTTPGGGGDMRGGTEVSVYGQITYILSDPFRYAGILLGYLFGGYLQNAAGYTCHFAYLGAVHYELPIMILLGIACFIDHGNFDRKGLKPIYRILALGICFVTIVLFATSMYVAYTNVGEGTIHGCQSRYLMPVIFPIAYCIGSANIRFEGSKRWRDGIFAACLTYILFASIWVISISQYC